MAKGFTFKQFHVDDLGCGMPVSTDGVLLGAWAKLQPQGEILDIGTGSGLLALMAAQRTNANAKPHRITALDIDSSAIKAAHHNFAHSPWHARLQAEHQDVLAWLTSRPAHSIDTIVCNPPYFNFGEQAQCDKRATARHTDTLEHQALIAAIKTLLTPTGVASFILPEYEGRQFITAANEYGLYCQSLCEIRTTEKKPVGRLLFALTPKSCETEIEQLCIHHQGQYSDAFIALTRHFYLNM